MDNIIIHEYQTIVTNNGLLLVFSFPFKFLESYELPDMCVLRESIYFIVVINLYINIVCLAVV